MKSRISFFNATVLRKDITRFAPAWGLYTVGMLLLCLSFTETDYDLAELLGLTVGIFSLINICYALVCGALLFGDLFNSRLCNSLHAMPLTRESWFVNHLISGLLFSLVPNLLVALCMMPRLGVYWFVAFVWLGGMTLTYLFFFGAAVLSAMCTGSRFAMTLVYGLINFVSVLVLWIAKFLYEPLLYGISISERPFVFLSPVSWLLSNELNFVNFLDKIHDYYNPNSGWPYVVGMAVMGAVMLVGALLLYRRRHLEAAGDLITVRPLSPVFHVLYTMVAGMVLFLFSYLFEIEQDYLFLAVGIIVGFITGQMLLKRTVQVFKPATFIGLAVMMAVIFGTMGLARIDVTGIAGWVPKQENVKYVSVRYEHDDAVYVATEQGEIGELIDVHSQLIDLRDRYYSRYQGQMELTYTLKDGRTVTRHYPLDYTTPAGQTAARYFSQPEYVMETRNVAALMEEMDYIDVYFYGDSSGAVIVGEDARELMEAIIADCEAGRWVSDWNYHEMYVGDYDLGTITIDVAGSDPRMFQLWSSATQTMAWLKEHGINPGMS